MEQIGKTLGQIKHRIATEMKGKIDKSLTLDKQALLFHEKLTQIIRPRNQSDRTCFRRITNWIQRRIAEQRMAPETFDKVLGFAIEAAGPDSRNPAAVFMKILKDEYGYGSNKT